ncbi:hypothetical protein D7W82_35685 [Corallococcus sp. CA049B]|nr:hypothetical protein D7W82_35685 [Corallococcus sp. CA049B]
MLASTWALPLTKGHRKPASPAVKALLFGRNPHQPDPFDVEVNDGGVSGLPTGLEPRDLFAALLG